MKFSETAAFLVLCAIASDARRVQIIPRAEGEDVPQERRLVFYAEDTAEQNDEPTVVIGARPPSYSRSSSQYDGRGSNQFVAGGTHHRQKPEVPKAPPVQTLRNFNKLNDDGSFTFGYEAADGSFKEETRGVDCVVRGKYGYVDPDGNKREFTYVSGNPCDPNAINDQDEDEKEKPGDEENIPANAGQRKQNYPLRGPKPRPTTTFFQQSFGNDEDARQEQQYRQDGGGRQEYRQESGEDINSIPVAYRPKPRPSFRSQEDNVIRSTSRPRVAYASTTRQVIADEPATTYRPQIVQFATSPAPVKQAKTFPPPTPTAFFEEQFKKFQLENNAIPSPPQRKIPPVTGNNPIYSTELVYDPATGQYNTVVYQQIPKYAPQEGRNDPRYAPATANSQFFHQQQQQQQLQQQQQQLQQQQQQQQLQQQQQPAHPQFLHQQQQAALVQQSQQLYNQQLKHQIQAYNPPPRFSAKVTAPPQRIPPQIPQLQRYPPDPKSLQDPFVGNPSPPPFYYVNAPDDRQQFSSGQIDAFLRGHNLRF